MIDEKEIKGTIYFKDAAESPFEDQRNQSHQNNADSTVYLAMDSLRFAYATDKESFAENAMFSLDYEHMSDAELDQLINDYPDYYPSSHQRIIYHEVYHFGQPGGWGYAMNPKEYRTKCDKCYKCLYEETL